MRIWLLALAALCACDTIQKVDQFSIEIATAVHLGAATSMEGTLTTFPELPGLTALDLSTTEGFISRNHGPEDVRTLSLTSLVLTATEGSDLSFLGEVRIFVEAEDQPAKFIARANSFPAGTRRIELELTEDDLAPWLVGTPGRVTVMAIRSDRPPQQTTLEFRLLFEVEVKVL